jgi:hypothetical protein
MSHEDGRRIPEMRRAMESELESYKTNDCDDEMQLSELPEGANLISTRWVLAIKVQSDGTKKHKARLVARGLEGLGKDLASSDAPAASTAAQRLVLAALAEKQWRPTSWDFKTAFLQGNPLARGIWIVPPDEFVESGVV